MSEQNKIIEDITIREAIDSIYDMLAELPKEKRLAFYEQISKPNVLAFAEKVKRYTEIEQLTPAIVNEFIDYIMVYKKQVIDGKTVYPIDIYYNGVGIITAPSAEEYEEMFQERLKQKRAKEQKTA